MSLYSNCQTIREVNLVAAGIDRGARRVLMDEARHHKRFGRQERSQLCVRFARERNRTMLRYMRMAKEGMCLSFGTGSGLSFDM